MNHAVIAVEAAQNPAARKPHALIAEAMEKLEFLKGFSQCVKLVQGAMGEDE